MTETDIEGSKMNEYERTEILRMGAEIGWDAAVSAMQYEDGTPVEIVHAHNPYRKVGKK